MDLRMYPVSDNMYQKSFAATTVAFLNHYFCAFPKTERQKQKNGETILLKMKDQPSGDDFKNMMLLR